MKVMTVYIALEAEEMGKENQGIEINRRVTLGCVAFEVENFFNRSEKSIFRFIHSTSFSTGNRNYNIYK